MIIIVKKSNIIMIALIFLLVIAIFSLNVGGEDRAVTVAKDKDVQKTVLLDPGHGGEDPGAVSDYSGAKEKDINLAIALKVRKLLDDDGYKVLMTREEDKLEYDPSTTNIVQKRKQDLLRRKKMMDEAGADIVVSIHLNKFGQTQYYGAQTFYPPGSAESQKLAVSIQKSLREMLDPNNSRQSLVQKDPMIILKNLKTTTAIVECGFLSNPEEEKKLVQEEYQDRIAAAIAEGINEYFGI
jgi:N-acetylmuramoyl-L-alanine amidase